MATDNPNDKGSIKDLKKTFEDLGKPMDQILNAIGNMYSEADKLNNAFLQGRTRLDEMNDAVSKAAAGVIRLGGDISDVGNTMIGIAEGARRNVIATEDQVSKLYAATTILGGSTKDLVDSFDSVGISVSQIGTNLENSIEYIQSVGLNAKDVMGDVTKNMEQMNRFQFDGGVQGLAKMAAQASMLKFDMKQTFAFADKVLDPEGAINMAAAFQRLGVSVGNLTDPFALMNESINDPTGLQNSLARVGEKYTVFDEKTKTFKINPQGVLILREMEKEAGLAGGTLSKSALAAADLDRRVSNINPSLKFDSEEDKQFLANMATMNKEGEYTVQLKNDKTGEVETKRLGDITQEEMEKLREQQENAPKTLEDIQKKQLDVLENIERAISGNVAKATYGIAGSSVIRGNVTGAERITRAVTGAVDKNVPESAEITKSVNNAVGKMSELFMQKDTGKISDADFAIKIAKLEEEVKNKASEYGSKGIETLKNILEETNKNITGSSGIEKQFKKYTAEMLTGEKEITPKSTKTSAISGTQKVEPLTRSQFFGKGSGMSTPESKSKTTNVNSQVDFGGTITIKVEAPAGVSEQQFKTFFESEEFKKKIYEYYNQKSKELEKR
jgi:hypothetical protein